jgi:lipoprotein-releasing system permease protein
LNFPFYIAKRYLFAKKSHNAINLISGISVLGVAVGTMALIVVLSVFNGFDNLIHSLFNTFSPDLQITVIEGKTFDPGDEKFNKIRDLEGVADFAEVLEDRALLRYNRKQTIATVKGVSENFEDVSGVDSMIVAGDFILTSEGENYTTIGQGIAYFLNVNINVDINYQFPIAVYVPRRTKQVTLNPEQSIHKKYIFPSGIFSIEQGYDSKYIIVPLSFARELFEYSNEVSAIEVKLKNDANLKSVQNKIKNILGAEFEVKNRYEQNELFYKTMQSEKYVIFLILVFILVVASFNVIGSLTMLILEKKLDISTLRSLGTDLSVIKKVFLYEGCLISLIGAIIGLFAGLLICWLQIKFKLVKLQGSGTFIIDAYPVSIEICDIIAVLFIVFFIGLIAAWYPIRYITKRFIAQSDRL